MVEYSHTELSMRTVAELEKIRDEKTDEYLEAQRKRFSLIGQIQHIQDMIEKEKESLGDI